MMSCQSKTLSKTVRRCGRAAGCVNIASDEHAGTHCRLPHLPPVRSLLRPDARRRTGRPSTALAGCDRGSPGLAPIGACHGEQGPVRPGEAMDGGVALRPIGSGCIRSGAATRCRPRLGTAGSPCAACGASDRPAQSMLTVRRARSGFAGTASVDPRESRSAQKHQATSEGSAPHRR
jgi:hypothetical protein